MAWPGLTHVAVNGVLQNTKASDAVTTLPDSHLLGRRTPWRALIRSEERPDDAERRRLQHEMLRRRNELHRRATDYVERHDDIGVGDQLERAVAQAAPGEAETGVIRERLKRLFADRLEDPGSLRRFEETVDRAFAEPGNATALLRSNNRGERLVRYRSCLDALRPKFGLPEACSSSSSTGVKQSSRDRRPGPDRDRRQRHGRAPRPSRTGSGRVAGRARGGRRAGRPRRRAGPHRRRRDRARARGGRAGSRGRGDLRGPAGRPAVDQRGEQGRRPAPPGTHRRTPGRSGWRAGRG